MTRKHGRRDRNHNEIKQFFKLAGFSAEDTADLGGGIPDIDIGKDGLTHCVEIKDGNKRLTKDEQYFHSEDGFQGSKFVVGSIDTAQILIDYHNRTVEWLDQMPDDWYRDIDLDAIKG